MVEYRRDFQSIPAESKPDIQPAGEMHPDSEPERTKEARTIFTGLLHAAKETRSTQEDRAKLVKIFSEFSEKYLGWSPSVFNDLPLREQLDFAVAFSRIPEAQGTVSQTMVGELTYGLNFEQKNTAFLADYIANLPIEEQIDTTLYLSTLHADAAAQGWAEHTVKNINSTLQTLQEAAHHNPFLRYAQEQTVKEVADERSQPTRGIVVFTGDPTVGRRQGLLSNEERTAIKTLQQKMKPEGLVATGFPMRVARDAIATVDHALFPQAIAFTQEHFEAHAEHDPRPERAEKLHTFLMEQQGSLQLSELNRIMTYAQNFLIPEETHFAKFWHTLIPNISQENWERFCQADEELGKVEDAIYAVRKQEMQAAEERNFQASKAMVAQVKKLTANALPKHKPFSEIQEKLDGNDFEQQFDACDNLAMIAKYQPDAPSAIHEAAATFDQLLNTHQNNFAQAKSQITATRRQYQDQMYELQNQIVPILDELLVSDIVQKLKQYTETLSRDDERITITFTAYGDILPNDNIKVGESGEKVDITLLLQEIHRPPIKHGLEDDMGVELKELSIREQLQLIPFLAEADHETQQRVFSLTQKFGTSAAQAFLSGEYGENFFTSVLNIGEHKDPDIAQNVFDRYAEISTIAQDAVNEIAQASLQGTSNKLDPQILQRELLTQAKKLLEIVARPGALTEDIQTALETTKAEVVLFASICKTYFKNNPEAKLEDVKGVALETQKSGHVLPVDQQKMVDVLRRNWAKKPQVADNLAADLENKLINPEAKANFYILKKDGRLLGFLSFSEGHVDAPDGVYGDSFNIDPEISNSGLGTALLSDVIDEESSRHPVYAHVDPDSPAYRLYTERFKFKQIGSERETMSDGSTVIWAKLRRFDQAS